jgi:putative tricarboxylic transport membrane protein
VNALRRPISPEPSDLVLAAAVAALGLLLLSGTSAINPGVGYDRVGPRFFPFVVAAGLIVLGVLLTLPAILHWRRPAVEATVADDSMAVSWPSLTRLGLAFVSFLALVEPAGFVVAAALQVWLVARAFHSDRPIRDLSAAVVISVVVFVAFSRLLGLTLPAGLLSALAD